MTDIDERVGRAGSQPRFQTFEHQQQPINDPLAKLINDYEHNPLIGDHDLLELVQRIEKNNPERCSKAPKFIAPLLTHRSAAIRKSAFAACLSILSHPQNSRQFLLDSYRLALFNSNNQIAQYALSQLPDFVDACPEEANNLIKVGSMAYKKLPAPSTEVEMHLSRALTKASQ